MTIEFPIETPVTNVVRFVNCCTGQEIFFRGSLPYMNGIVVTYLGELPFAGSGGSLEPTSDEFGACYTFYSEYQDEVPGYPPIAPVSNLFSPIIDGCQDPNCFCPGQSSNCYMVIPCDGTDPVITNNQAFQVHVNSFITVKSLNYQGCAYITALSYTDCLEVIAIEPVDEPCECDLNCYYVANTNGFFYVDSNDVLQNVSPVNAQPYIKVCSKIPPVAESGSVKPQIINLGPCEEDECPIQCFKLVNCKNTDLVIYTTSNSLLPYVYGPNNIVNVLGKEGCWTALELDEGEECDCPIDITVTSSFATCSDCIGIKAYKLISCEDNSTIYTYLNLEAYINQIVKLDCGCYKVEEINYAPPNPQVVKLEDIYPNCTACLRTHWKLTDCTNPDNSVITYTDLSLYTENVIKIEGCTECWLVEATEDYLNAVEVVVIDDYEDCEECSIPTLCNCTKVTNLNEVPKVYSYFDCDNVFQEILLQPGESSEKVCATRWLAESSVEPAEFTVYDHFETFGECKFGTCPPPVFKNNRTVKPGYNTPNCNPEEYDKITCRFADVMYKLVLEKRYGISNCCPDEDEKWLMKKELIDLQALKSPDYTAPILVPTPVPVIIPKAVIPPAPCPVPPAPPVPTPCNQCIKVRFIPITPSGLGNAVTLYISSSGVYPNNTDYYTFTYDGVEYEIYNETYNSSGADPGGWYLYAYDETNDIGYNSTVGTCPTGTFVMSEPGYFNNFTVSLCGNEETDYVLYSVFIDGGGNSSFFTYPDCADQIRTENFPPSRSGFRVLVCSKPGQISQFVSNAVTFIVTETTTTCNC